MFPWEGHAWEQVLTGAAHAHMPGCRVVGYDNLNFSSLALSLYPSADEVGVRPLPDVVVTNGPTFSEVLRASAFPATGFAPAARCVTRISGTPVAGGPP